MVICSNPAVQRQVQNPAALLNLQQQGQVVMLSFAAVSSVFSHQAYAYG